MKEQWLTTDNLEELPRGSERGGYCYAIEFGNNIKIGCTNNLRVRISTLKGNMENYSEVSVGRFAYTEAHANHRENERKLHSFFSGCRINKKAELFAISLDDFIEKSPALDCEKKGDDVANGCNALLVSLFPGFAEFLIKDSNARFSKNEIERIGENLEALGRDTSKEVKVRIFSAQGNEFAEKDFFDVIPRFARLE